MFKCSNVQWHNFFTRRRAYILYIGFYIHATLFTFYHHTRLYQSAQPWIGRIQRTPHIVSSLCPLLSAKLIIHHIEQSLSIGNIPIFYLYAVYKWDDMSGMQIQWFSHRQAGIEVFIRYLYLTRWYNIIFFVLCRNICRGVEWYPCCSIRRNTAITDIILMMFMASRANDAAMVFSLAFMHRVMSLEKQLLNNVACLGVSTKLTRPN